MASLVLRIQPDLVSAWVKYGNRVSCKCGEAHLVQLKAQICTGLDLNTWWLRLCQWRQQWDDCSHMQPGPDAADCVIDRET